MEQATQGAAGAAVGGPAWWLATLLLPSLALAVALRVDDLGLVVGILGAVLGGAIMYVVPAAVHALQLLASSPPAQELFPFAKDGGPP